MAESTHSTRSALSSDAISAASLANSAKLSTLSVGELITYYGALKAVADAIAAQLNMPRVDATAVSPMLEDMVEAYDREVLHVVELIRSRRPSDPWMRAERARLLIGFECEVGETLPNIADLVAQLLAGGRQ